LQFTHALATCALFRRSIGDTIAAGGWTVVWFGVEYIGNNRVGSFAICPPGYIEFGFVS
jgi:hypothetical protein